MGRFTLRVMVWVALATAGFSVASADVPSVVAVQGRLTDANGAPLAAGAKSFTFRIYDDAAAGTKIWPAGAGEIQSITTNDAGSWSALVGAVDPLSESFFADPERWLEIEVDGTLLPRSRLVTGPYAFRVATIEGADGGHLNSVLSAPQLEIGGASQSGLIELYRTGSATPAIVLDGAVEPQVGINGTERSVVFDMGQTGGNSVALPLDAISSAEILDEPGVASNDRHAEFVLTGGIDLLTSRSLTAPTAGYVLAIATGEVIDIHTNGTNSTATFGLSTDPAAFLAVQNITQIPSTAPTGTYKIALAAQTIIPVAAGATSVYLLGQEVGGNLRASDLELSLLFVPSAYGTVDALAASNSHEDTDGAAAAGARHSETEQHTTERIEREMAALRAEIDDLRAKLALQQGAGEPPR